MSDFWVGPVDAPDTYRLVSLLGGGGEGEVWRAVLPLSGEGRRTVAIKIARPRSGQHAQWTRFGHLLQSLSHPGLVRVTDVFLGPAMHRQGGVGPAATAAPTGQDGLSRYVVMDYIDGTNLREWVAENSHANASQRLRLLSMVAAALDTMHSGATTEVPVAHGDVKPANIVVRSDDAAILVDLGLARLTDAEGVAGRSAAYAAPELRRRGYQATPAADRFAFAVTTAQILTGQAPPVGADGWLDPDALRAMLASSPLTGRRHVLTQRIMDMIHAPPEARTGELRPWLDGAMESLSQVTNTDDPVTTGPAAGPAPSPTGVARSPGRAEEPSRAEAPPAPAARSAAGGRAADRKPAAGAATEGRGELFGPYRLDELIGRGGMGEVYRATDTTRNRVVALKRLPAGMADDPGFNARFREESRLAAQLNEPHIIPIHDFGEIAGRLYIDMRLVEGTDLSQLLAAEGALSPGRAVGIVRQVASALDAAHAAGLVHRDVKPANVLLRATTSTVSDADSDGGDDFAYLVDFGIARATSNTRPGLTATGSAIGSVTYMAPERFSGRSDPRADVYSLGCLLYEALTGQQPFPTTDTVAAMSAHLYQPPPRPSATRAGVPAAFDDVIAMALAKQPEQRYASAGALAAAARTALTAAARNAVTSPAPADASGAGTARVTQAGSAHPHATATGSHVAATGPHAGATGPHAGTTGPAQSPHPQTGPAWDPHVTGPAWDPQRATRPAPYQPGPYTGPHPVYWNAPAPQPADAPERRSNTPLAVAAVLLLLVVAALGGYALFAKGRDPAPRPKPTVQVAPPAQVIAQEPIRTAGANPFTPPVGRDAPGAVQPPESRGGYSGSTPGLYGGTVGNAECDRAAMISYLRAVPGKAAAWAEVQSISAANVPSYINRLTPLILRADTAVTNHGFAEGGATALPSVLQTGTAVLVDAYGVPRARCASGNPLTEARPAAGARYASAAWATFNPANVVTIEPSPTPMAEFLVIDLTTGNRFLRPTGTSGDRDHTR